MFDCPEHTHTSPKSTFASVMVRPAESEAVMSTGVKEAAVGGIVAIQMVAFSQVDATADTALAVLPPTATFTSHTESPQNPQIVACENVMTS